MSKNRDAEQINVAVSIVQDDDYGIVKHWEVFVKVVIEFRLATELYASCLVPFPGLQKMVSYRALVLYSL